MNIIKAGSMYKIYGEDVQTFSHLPVKTYRICFSQMNGYSLETMDDLAITEEKIYGNSIAKVHKAMNSYKITNRNFGVLLSGPKGIGKSLFLRLLAREGIHEGYPVLMVTMASPGLPDFISSIKQDCLVIFDEFEKLFSTNEDGRGEQEQLLSLFDGLDGGHKMFISTCNDINQISEYMLNRPGRFHYHFVLSSPAPDEVQEYLKDKLDPKYHEVIQDVVNLSSAINMPYDYLRAIVFDLNQGHSLKETMNDLNITKEATRFDIQVRLSNGLIYECHDEYIDFTNKNRDHFVGRNYKVEGPIPSEIVVYFYPNKVKIINGLLTINKTDIAPIDWKGCINPFADEGEGLKLLQEYQETVTVETIIFKKSLSSSVSHYNI